MNAPSGIAPRTVAAARRVGPRGLELLLYGLQSPINIGMILRVAETYEFRVSIYDPHRVLESGEVRTIKDFCLRGPRHGGVIAPSRTMRRLRRCSAAPRRLVAPRSTAHVPLPSHRFQVTGDMFALGNNRDGRPTIWSRAPTGV